MSVPTRRRFLEDSLLAAAAAAVGPATMSFAQAEGENSGPNEKLAVAVVGTGGQGGDHLRAFASRKDTEVTVVCDADETRAQKAAEGVAKLQDGKKPQVVLDMRKAFDDKSVDLVSTATPNHWHSLVALWAMEAGKDVYAEKPLSHNVFEGRQVVKAARKHGRICQVGTQCRSTGGMIAAIDFVRSGKIGEVKLARGLCHRDRQPIGPPGEYPVPKGVDYNLWLGPAPEGPVTRPRFHYDWHWQRLYGNGDLGNQGVHQMDIAMWGLGVDRLSDSVYSYGGRVGKGWDEDAGDTANTQVVVHRFGDKTLVFEVRNMKCPPLLGAGVGVIFYGTEGNVVITSYNGGAAFDMDGKQIETFSAGGDHYDNFIKAVRSRKVEDLNADVLQGHLSASLCHLGNISYYLGAQMPIAELEKALGGMSDPNEDVLATFGRVKTYLTDNELDLAATQLALGPVLKVDPAAETILENDAANLMLAREYRAPFVVPQV